MEKTVKYGEYQITKADNGSISVLKNDEPQKNTMAALREIAALIDLKIEDGWNTQQTGAKLIKAIEQLPSEKEEDNGSIDINSFLSNFAPMGVQENNITPTMRLVQLAMRMCVSPDEGFKSNLFDFDQLLNIASAHGFKEEAMIDAYNKIAESGELLGMDEITDGVSTDLADAIIATCCYFCLTNEQVYKYQIATIHGFCKECGIEGHSVTLWLIEALLKKVKYNLDIPKFETIDF